MKWIKASEMLSPDLRAIHIKRPPNGFPVIGHYVPSKNQYWIPIYGEYWDIEKVEWLDESAESDSGEQVRKLKEGLGEMISTIERNAVDNRAMIENVKLWAKSWREELLDEMYKRNCGHCKTETMQYVKLYNPDNPDEGEVWECSICKENTDWVTT